MIIQLMIMLNMPTATITRTMIMATPTITIIMMAVAVTTMLMTLTTKSGHRAREQKTAVVGGIAERQADSLASASVAVPEDDRAALYRLMTWLSPSFPVGAFSYSSGLEWAVEAGDVIDASSSRAWLASMLSEGAGFCDGVFLAHAHRRVADGDQAGLIDLAELAAAFVPSRERQLETTTQGKAFIAAARAAWTCEALERVVDGVPQSFVYPIAVGIVSAAHRISLRLTVHAFLHALTANWISAAARLVPLGQTESQRILAALEPVVNSTADRALAAGLDDIASTTFRADLASMRHEAQYTRLFRS